MFLKEVGLMLYVNDVALEKTFWTAIGFEIVSEQEMMGYETFDMKPHIDSTMIITVYAKEFIEKVSPEVIEMTSSLLFETNDIEQLHTKVAATTKTVSQINQEPFPNFNFANPSGHYFAVKGIG